VSDVLIRTNEPPRLRVISRLGELWRHREILANLARKELRVKYKSTVLGVAWSMATLGMNTAPLILIGCVAVLVVAVILMDYRVGLYLVLVMGVFMFYIDRILQIKFPLGTVYDGLVALVFAALFVNSKNEKDWTSFQNPVSRPR
jgi:hypothetical protein